MCEFGQRFSRSSLWLLCLGLSFSLHCWTATRRTYAIGDIPCDRVVRLRLNESFAFSVFPPDMSNHALASYASFSLRRRGPQECTWVFEAEDCQLEFHQRVSAYSRGGVDCSEQYFLFGDENREQRFCGFKKPPRHMNSTGSRFFMTHFQRNGRLGVRTRVGGQVRCGPLIPPVPACVPTPLTCRRGSQRECTHPGTCFTLLDIALSPAGHFEVGSNFTSTITCNPAVPEDSCHSSGQICFETVPVGCTGPLLTQLPPLADFTTCSEPAQLTCVTPGNCTADFLWLVTATNGDENGHSTQLFCSAESEHKCVFYGNACYSPK